METRHNGQSAAEKVVDFIKEMIIKKKFRSGDRLPTEAEFCELTGVSRGGVREAMKILEANRIVDIRRGDGTYLCTPEQISFANPLTFKLLLRETSFAELCAFRESVETAVLRLAMCNCDELDLRKMRESNARMRAVVEQDACNYQALYDLDMEFHRLLADAMKNEIMRDVYLLTFDVFGQLILRNYQTGQTGASGQQTHEAILKALESKDFLQMGHAIKKTVSLWGKWIVHSNAAELLVNNIEDGV